MSEAKLKPIRCLLDVRDISLEHFRHPRNAESRKWRQAALGRHELLFKLSSWANPDGSFGQHSPSFKRLVKHYNRSTLFRRMDDLRDLGFLSWTRENHYKQREYKITLPEAVQQQVPGSQTEAEKQVPHSTKEPENRSHIQPKNGKQVPHSQEQVPHSPIHPSLPSLKEPSNPTATEKDFGWVAGFFVRQFGQGVDKKKIALLFGGRKPKAVKGTIEKWRNDRRQGFEGLNDPFGALEREIDVFYDSRLETSEDIEMRMQALAETERAEIAREDEMRRASEPTPEQARETEQTI